MSKSKYRCGENCSSYILQQAYRTGKCGLLVRIVHEWDKCHAPRQSQLEQGVEVEHTNHNWPAKFYP